MPQISQGNLMSRAAFARHMGVSPRTVTDRIRAGTVIVDKTTNKIKVRESKARWLAPGPALGRGDVQGPDPERSTLTAVRTQHERTKQQVAELRLRKARGELIDRETHDGDRVQPRARDARQLPVLAGTLRGHHRGQATHRPARH